MLNHFISMLDGAITFSEGARLCKLKLAACELFVTQNSNWARQAQIIGFGIGSKATESSGDDRNILRVYLPESVAMDKCDVSIPSEILLPNQEVVETQVITISMPKFEGNKVRIRPFGPGASISHVNHAPGTLCARVTPKLGTFSGKVFMLSCHHVLYPRYPRGERVICQPAADFIQSPVTHHDVIGLCHGDRHAKFNPYRGNLVDAGIAQVKPRLVNQFANNVVNGVYQISSIARQIEPDTRLIMFGAASAVARKGRVLDAEYRGKFKYKSTESSVEEVKFYDVVQANYNSQAGDSGSPVFILGTRILAGMHFAGGGGYGYFCKASNIFRALNLKLSH